MKTYSTELITANYSFQIIDQYLIMELVVLKVMVLESIFRRNSKERHVNPCQCLDCDIQPYENFAGQRGSGYLRILGTPPPDPPPGVEELDSNKELTGNLRQCLEQHRDDPNCASCHALMDPLGFVYENFDGIGRWREEDEGAD